tara:strand:+ start:582 stop:875 length:294 start_codon:yes stop_codon:yes gene_type:complete
MAVGDFTVNANTRVSLGSATMITGTVEVDTNATTSAILPNSTIIAFWLNHNLDDDDVTATRVHINSSDFASTAANGSVHIQATAGAPDTWAWTAVYK